MKSSNIGGQAVLEGIMMRHKDVYSVAVRKPDGEIEVKVEPYKALIPWKGAYKLPILRGVCSFLESLVIGTKCLMYSSTFYEEEEEEKPKTEEELKKKEKEDKAMVTSAIALSLVLCIGLFIMLPYFASRLLRLATTSETLITILEAVLRLLIFFGYILVISRMEDIRRTFMYHGAEHKCINCIEHGMELNVENVMKSSREHKRCGTSFLFFVVVVSVIFFLFIHVSSPVGRIVIRLLLIPVIAGVSFEIIRLAGSSDHPLVSLLSKPGLLLQRMTTAEPDASMVEVAIAAVEAVFDWKAYLAENGIEVKEK
jgi:uncharacterized protein YqhQ